MRTRASAEEREASGTNARTRKGSGGGVVQGDKRAKQARQPGENAAGAWKGRELAGRSVPYIRKESIADATPPRWPMECGEKQAPLYVSKRLGGGWRQARQEGEGERRE